MANRIVKIDDICHVVKGETGIMKAIPGEFPLVVLSEERKTHNEYQFDCKAVIIPLVSSTGHGHASMKRIHYQEGKFALGSILCALVPKNKGEYDPEYLYHILNMGKERIFVPLMKGMANVSLPMNRIKSVEINLPPYDEQVRLSKIYSEVTNNLDLLKNHIDKQHKYLKQLRQSILQLAVQGKLTLKWRVENPNIEPASVLLERIKQEKERLIKEGLVKREKPIPKLIENTDNSDLLKNWVWTILDDLVLFSNGKAHEQYIDSNGQYILINSKYISQNGTKIKRTNKLLTPLFKKDIAIVMSDVPNGKALARCFLVDNDNQYTLNQRIGGLTPLSDLVAGYLLIAVERNKHYLNFDNGKTQTNLKKDQILSCPVPLPSVLEQQEIVSIVNHLMKIFDELEKKIVKRDSYQERIMQAVVKQVFTTIKE
jgi:type I restriction enzyme, S subunit